MKSGEKDYFVIWTMLQLKTCEKTAAHLAAGLQERRAVQSLSSHVNQRKKESLHHNVKSFRHNEIRFSTWSVTESASKS